MIGTKRIAVIGLILLFAFGFTACGDKEPKPPKPGSNFQAELEGAPDWVVKGCSAYWGDKAKDKLCGVGSMGGTRNISLARQSAISRGRAEIATSLQVQVKRLVKDYQATVTGGEGYGTQASDEQYVADVSKQITNMTLSGTEMVEIWTSKSGTIYALVVLDVEKFKSAVAAAQNLDQQVRDYVEKNAAKAFDELDAATAE